jgi:hypothetical protein
MKKRRGAAITIGALAIAGLVAPVGVWAATNATLAPQARTTHPAKPKPKAKPTGSPVVNVGDNKEGATASASVTDRLHVSKPSHPKTSRKTSEAANTRAPKAADPPRSKEDPVSDSTDRTDLKLNIGICGRMQNDGTVPGPTRCQPGGEDRVTRRKLPPTVVLPRPEDITWEQVRSETKNIIFPGLSVKVQPKGQTLVNMATIVYTDDSKVSTTTVTLLGFPVVVEATPISYTWDFGDKSPTLTTSTPGKPYPSAEITHKYLKREGVGITVTTNYAARFNVADTGWQYIEGTVPITGPATLLQVREAVPVLVDPDR